MKRSENKQKVCVHPSAIKLLTETTWKFAHALLWQHFPFSKEEIELAKAYIKEYYLSIPAKKFQALAIQYFRNYRAYIRLAKKYISRLPESYVAEPSLWLDHKSLKRFCKTKANHHCLLKKRNNQCLILQQCETCPFNSTNSDFHFTA
jgi:hypothetical protein